MLPIVRVRVGLSALPLALVLAANAGCTRTVDVDVEMTEGKIAVQPSFIRRANYVTFTITNGGKKRHHFVVAETTTDPARLAVVAGHVRKCIRPGEPHLTFYGDHGGWELGCRPDGRTDPEDTAELDEEGSGGIALQPGETATFDKVGMYDVPFASGTRFVVYCDEGGHYESGENAHVVVK
jgi:hypothetical protein